MRTILLRGTALAAILTPAALLGTAQAAPVVAPGYTLTLLTASPAGDTGADSITTAGGNFYVGYGDHHLPDGSDGLSSTIVEYSMTGSVLGSTTVVGHNDGLRFDAATGQIWALQNEDANPNLVLINPTSLAKSAPYSIPNPHGGGYDDVAFSGGNAYLTASNPNLDASGNSLGLPALVKASVPTSGSTLSITPVLSGTAAATNVNTGSPTTLNITDPDGVTLAPNGTIQFASQGDSTLITVQNPGAANQQNSVLSAGAQLDDIEYPTSGQTTVLFTDATTNNLYSLTGPFAAGSPYVAASFPDGSPDGLTSLSELNLSTGALTALVTGVNPGGLAFVTTASVPEPASIALLGIGLLGVVGLRSRRPLA